VSGWDLTRWQNERASHWLVQAWVEGLQQALSARAAVGAAAQVRVVALPPDPREWGQWSGAHWHCFDATIAAGARLAVGCSAETEQAVGQWISGGALDTAGARQVYLGLLQCAVGSVAQAAAIHLKVPPDFGDAGESSLPGFAALGVSCHFALAGAAHTVALAPNEVLLVTLLSEEGGGASSDAIPAELPADAGLIPELAMSPHARQNLEMLLDVDLELSVSFGHTTLLLQEVLKLSSGSIVELNRSANDPVELMVNNAVVARGEVVVVDGNYGIRVTEVVSQRERIRSLL
jgi:flagellar motor switch protein FliN/FliY